MNRFTQASVRVLSVTGLALAISACEGSEVRRTFNPDATTLPDAPDADTSDAEVEGGSIDFQVLTATGPRGLGDDEITLVPADEPAAYVAVAGFQIDFEVRTTGVADGTAVQIFVDDAGAAPDATIEVGEDDVGVATFSGITVPTTAGGITVRFVTTNDDGDPLTVDKVVVLDIGQCELELAFETDGDCLVTEERDGQIGVPLTATLVEGRCQIVQVGWSLDAGGISGGTLPDATFDEQGEAALFIALGNADETFQGELTVTATAVHEDDDNGDDVVEVTTPIDNRPPAVTWVSPDPEVTMVLGLADDVAPGTDGVQVDFVVEVDEAGDVALLVDGVTVETVTAAEAGEVTFEAVTLPAGEVEVGVRATDACGNEETTTATFEVLEAIGLTIVTPEADAVLLAASDADPTTTAIYEATWEVSASGEEVGATISILCKPTEQDETVDFITVGQTTVTTIAEDGRYDVAIAIDTLAPLGLTCVARLDTPEVESDEIQITLAFPGPRLAISEPLANACFNTKSIPVAGTALGLRGREVEFTLDDGQTGVVGTVADASGEAAWAGTIALLADTVDGRITIAVDATDQYGNVVSDTQGPVETEVVLDTTQPILAMTQPAGTTIGPEGDTAPGTPGYQTTVVATLTDTNALGGRLCLALDNGTPTCRDVAGASVSFTGVTLVPGANLLTLTGEDACGNTGPEVMRLVTLQIDNPLTIVSPLDGATLLAADDGDPATARVFEADVVVEAPNLEEGSPLVIACRASAGVAFTTVGQITAGAPPADDLYTVAVAIDTDVLGTSVVCRAAATLPAASTSPEIDLVLGLPAPTLTITAPAADACLASRTFTVSGASTSLVGRTVTLSGATGTATVAAGGAWTTTGTVSADGPVTVGATASDTFGNPASATGVAIDVDTVAPTLALQAPASPINPDEALDEDPVTTGYQTTLTVAMSDTHAVGGEICIAVGGGPLRCAEVPAAGAVDFAGVTLQPGDNTVTLSGDDACGVAAVGSTATLNLLETGDLTVVITTPAADLVTAATTLDYVVTVSDEDGPFVGATVRLGAEGDPGNGPPGVDQGDGTYLFEDVALPLGATTTFIATARSGPREGQSEGRVVTQKDVQPTVTITAPPDGSALNLASAACQAGQEACILTVSAATTDAEDGSGATLTRDCDGAVVTAPGTVSADAVSFAGVTLPHGATCTLTIEVVDAVGQSASDSATVTVDRVAPTADITAPGLELTTADDLAAGEPGVQAALTVELSGVEAGQVASALLTWTSGGTAQSKTVTHTVDVDTSDDQVYVAAFEEIADTGYITWPDAFVTITVTVADAAGNEATDAWTVAVNVGANVRITGPTDTADTCGGTCAVGVCQDGACYRTWGTGDTRRLVVNVTGLSTTTQNLRVCSDHASLAGAPGAITCASAPSATGPYYQILIVDGVNGTANLNVPNELPIGFQRLVVEAQTFTGGAWSSSLATATATERQRRVLVDLTPPVVSALVVLSDTQAPVDTLNIAEQAAPGRQYDVRLTASEAGLAEVFANGVVVASQQVPAGDTTVRVTLPEGSVQLWVVLTDVVVNKSPLTPVLGALTLALTVDVTAPTLAFTLPNKSPLNAADNRNVVLTSNTVDGQVVTVFDAGVQVATGPIAGGSVTFSGLLTDGSHTLTASINDRAGNPASAVSSPATVVVDTQSPTLTVSAPTQGQALSDGDDADAGTAGYQVAVSFTSGGGASGWSIYVAQGCDALGNNCQPRELEASGTGEGAIARNITVDILGALSFMKFTVEAADAAGNITAVARDVSVLITSCQIAFTNLPASGWYNIANACPGGTPCASADVAVDVGQVGICPPITRLALFDAGVEIGSIDSPGVSESFTVTIGDGDHLALEARAFNGAAEVAATGVRERDVDFTPPVVAFAARSVGGFTTPGEGASVSYNTIDDLLPNTAGMQMNASIDVWDDNASGGQVTAIVSVGSGTVALTPTNLTLPATISGTSPIAVDLLGLTLTDLETQVVTLTATDAAGNPDTASFTASVDVTRPGEPQILQVAVEMRRGRAQPLAYRLVGDNGTTGDPVAAYEVRYSQSPIDETNFASACSANVPELLGSDAIPAPGAPGGFAVVNLGGPDTRPFSDPCKLDIGVQPVSLQNALWRYWAVRARDAAGNWSPIGAASTRGVTYGWLLQNTITFNTSGGGWATNTVIEDVTFRGTSVGDIDEDGVTDYAIGSFQARTFCVIKGHAFTADETITTPSGANHTCLTTNIFAGTGNPFMGHEIAALGDINGDNIDDFGVTGRVGDNTAASVGAAVIYLGRAGQLPDLMAPQIVLRGMLPSATTAYFGLCSAGDFDGVLTAGVATNDFVITAIPATAKNYAAVIPGRTSWTPTMAQVVFDLTDVNGGITAAGGLKIEWDERTDAGAPANGGSFGTRCAPVGDLLPTPAGLGTGAKGDIAITQTSIIDARVFIIPGREWTAGTIEVLTEDVTGIVTPSTAEDMRAVRLRQDNDTVLRNGFGGALFGGVDLNNDGVNDVVVVNPNRSVDNPTPGDGKTIHIFDGSKIAAAAGLLAHRIGAPTAPATPPEDHIYVGTNGWIVRASVANNPRSVRPITDFNDIVVSGRPTIDLAISTFTGSEVRLRTNHSGGPKAFPLATFPVIDGIFDNPVTPGTDSTGTWIDGGFDMSGDGRKDLIVGSRKGQLIIVR